MTDRKPIAVLIVEDEPEFLGRFSDAVLEDPHLRLVGAVSTGRAGLALLDAHHPMCCWSTWACPTSAASN